MKTTNTDILKKQMIVALEKSLGVVTTACKEVGIHRSTYYDWYNNDEQFRVEVDSISNVALDFAESQLYTQIKEGNTTATIFYLKTKGKNRGYVERSEHITKNYEVPEDPLKEFRDAFNHKAAESD